MTSREAVLEVENLHVRFDANGNEVHAVRGVSFSVAKGERLGLVGESGCGKSTTVLALMGLLPTTAALSGDIRIGQFEVLGESEAAMRRHRWVDVALVFQGAMNALNPVMPIGTQIAEPIWRHGLASKSESRAQVAGLLELVGLPASFVRRYPHELSGGMRQRASIAMALACRPRVLLADEPTTALDLMVQAQIVEVIDQLCNELGLALVLVSHDLALVAEVCTHMAVMYAGELIERGTPEHLYRNAHHPYTEGLFRATLDPFSRSPAPSIGGQPPRLDLPISGCPFLPRCEAAFTPCTEAPRLRTLARSDHQAACHLPASSPHDG